MYLAQELEKHKEEIRQKLTRRTSISSTTYMSCTSIGHYTDLLTPGVNSSHEFLLWLALAQNYTEERILGNIFQA